MENHQLVSPSLQCSSKQVGFGQRWQRWNDPHTLLTWLQLIFTCSLDWNQHWRDGASLMLRTSLTLTLLTWRVWWAPTNACKWQMGFNSAFKGLRMRWKSWKGFHKMGFQECFQHLYSRWQKCINCTRGIFWRKCNLNYCTVLYFSEIKWFRGVLKLSRTDSPQDSIIVFAYCLTSSIKYSYAPHLEARRIFVT